MDIIANFDPASNPVSKPQSLAILMKLFGDLMNHITREYAGKKIEIFLNISLFTIAHLLL